MTLAEDFNIWQEKLEALSKEGEKLATDIAQMEQQNTDMRKRLAESDTMGGFKALKDLYDDGYHICPGDFGQKREEECLFCLEFLLHKGRK